MDARIRRDAEGPRVGPGGDEAAHGRGLPEHLPLHADVGLRHAGTEALPSGKPCGGRQGGDPDRPGLGKIPQTVLVPEIAVLHAVQPRLQGQFDALRPVHVGHDPETLPMGDADELGDLPVFQAASHEAARGLKVHDAGDHELDEIRLFLFGPLHQRPELRRSIEGMAHDPAVLLPFMGGKDAGAVLDPVFPGNLPGIGGSPQDVSPVPVIHHSGVP